MGNMLRRVAIYGRVSTEHESQLAAMDNQRDWYESVALQHPDWVIVERYFDEGITGTAAQKRPAFMRMIADAEQRKFDLVITREVCRFARNTVDTLTYTRQLKNLGVEVYFINDNIRSFDNDGELRLTIMASLAQEESRKVSERVRAGQAVSREKGVLYGTGNILGYDRVNGTYVINPEEADTVRRIFELYSQGLGYKKICAVLTTEGRKGSSGVVNWQVDRIGRILRNATYAGYLCYNKSHSDGFLTQKRVNHRQADYIYKKGDFEPIVSEELWQLCEKLREAKSSASLDASGKPKKFGRKTEASVWTQILRCSCGSTFRRYLWRQNENGTKMYGFECYRRSRSVSAAALHEAGLEEYIACETRSIPGWHLDLIAKKVFALLWGDQGDAVHLACQILQQCSADNLNQVERRKALLAERRKRLEQKKAGLREMRALGDISREDFLTDTGSAQRELDRIDSELSELDSSKPQDNAIDLNAIRATLEAWTDFSGVTVPDALIEQFVRRAVVLSDDTMRWILDLKAPTNRSLSADKTQASDIDEMKDATDIMTLTITEEDAAEYCRQANIRFFKKKWRDKTIILAV